VSEPSTGNLHRVGPECHLDVEEGDCGYVEVECEFATVAKTCRDTRRRMCTNTLS